MYIGISPTRAIQVLKPHESYSTVSARSLGSLSLLDRYVCIQHYVALEGVYKSGCITQAGLREALSDGFAPSREHLSYCQDIGTPTAVLLFRSAREGYIVGSSLGGLGRSLPLCKDYSCLCSVPRSTHLVIVVILPKTAYSRGTSSSTILTVSS